MILSPLPSNPWYRITQRFGENPAVYAQFGFDGHNGIDFAPFVRGRTDYIVYAPHEGFVETGYNEGGYGNYVRITGMPYNKKKHRRRSDLAHLSNFIVQDGQWVAAGDPVGIMGSTGFSTGIHLHWTYKVLDKDVILNRDNGFNGALDIGKYALQWKVNSNLG